MSALLRRRDALLAAGAWALARGTAAQPGRPAAKPVVITQVIDVSPGQQDVSKDFLVGARAFWQDANARGGVRGRPVQHTVIEVDAGAAAVRAAARTIRDNAACVAISGTAGENAATALASALRDEGVAIAHAAPWLQNSSVPVDDRTFPIFASRQEQIAHALRSLSVMSVAELGVVYADEADFALQREDLARVARELNIRVQHFRAGGDLVGLGQKLTPSTPAILLFVGGTPELAQFTQGLAKQARQRYIVALADVNLQTLVQMGASRSIPVIATQPVPLVTASLPIVRAYRDVLARLFDEPPASLSLAGFIAARYTFDVLSDADAGLTRGGVLAAFQRRASMDVGGFRIRFDERRRGGTFVTQSMLTPDGRVIG